MSRKYFTLMISAAGCFCLWAPAGAAVPAGDSAGSQEARFRQEKLLTSQKPAPEKKSESAVSEPADADRERAEAPAPAGASIKIPVQEVHFVGNYSIPSAELKPLVQDLVGREVTLDDIQTAVSRVKKYYREKGYIATYAYVPQQEVKDGTVSIDVIEGRLGDFRIEGGRYRDATWFRRQFSIQSGEVLTYEKIRRDLDRLNRSEDIRARLALEAGKQMGKTDAVVTVEESYPIHLSADLDNSGTRNTGLYRWGTTLRHNNLTGHSDSLALTGQASSGVSAVGAAYEVPILDTPARLGYQFSSAGVDIGGPFESLEAQGTAVTHSLYATRPLWEGSFSASGTAGFDIKEVKNKILGEVSGDDQLRILRLETQIDGQGEGHKSLLGGGVYVGIPGIFGGSDKEDPLATRAGTGGQFFAARGQGAHYRQVAQDMLLLFRGSAQASTDSLPPSEQFRLGGARSVRGYSESDSLSDYGVQVSAELFFPVWLVPENWRLPTGETVRESLQLFVFGDFGWGELNKPGVGEAESRTLSGAGAGIRMHLVDRFYARVEWGFPFGDEPADGRRSAFYFTISYDFF